MHNLTVFELGRNVGTCYTWTEHEHLRGANDIATCLSKWLESKDSQGIKEVVLFSDSTVSPNRNRSFSTMIIHTFQTAVNLKSITHKVWLLPLLPSSFLNRIKEFKTIYFCKEKGIIVMHIIAIYQNWFFVLLNSQCLILKDRCLQCVQLELQPNPTPGANWRNEGAPTPL